MKKKVLLVVPLSTLEWGSKNSGGVDSVCQMLVEYLSENQRSDFLYRVLAFDPFSESTYTGEVIRLSSNVEVIRCPVNEKFFSIPLPGFMTGSFRVNQQVRQYQPDITHSHINSWIIGAPRSCIRVLSLHSYKQICRKSVSLWNDFFYVKVMPYLSRSFVDYYTCVGDLLVQALEKDISKGVSLIGNPVSREFFIDRVRLRKKHPLMLVTCALLSRRKNIHCAIKLIQKLKEEGIDVRLKIIGPPVDSGYYDELKELVQALKVERDIEFLGGLNREEIISTYQSADVGVFFSEQETFGLAPIEMMASGLPLLTTEVGVLSENKTKFEELGVRFIQVSSVEEQIKGVIDLRHFNSAELVDFIKSNFSVKNVINRYEDLYRRLLSV